MKRQQSRLLLVASTAPPTPISDMLFVDYCLLFNFAALS